jgi:hypothetical protein
MSRVSCGIALGERVARKTYASRAMSAAYETSSDGCAREGQGYPQMSHLSLVST